MDGPGLGLGEQQVVAVEVEVRAVAAAVGVDAVGVDHRDRVQLDARREEQLARGEVVEQAQNCLLARVLVAVLGPQEQDAVADGHPGPRAHPHGEQRRAAGGDADLLDGEGRVLREGGQPVGEFRGAGEPLRERGGGAGEQQEQCAADEQRGGSEGPPA